MSLGRKHVVSHVTNQCQFPFGQAIERRSMYQSEDLGLICHSIPVLSAEYQIAREWRNTGSDNTLKKLAEYGMHILNPFQQAFSGC
jgi:hypothetical protein